MGLGIKRTALFFSFFHVLNLVSAQNRGSPETRPSILWGDEGEAIQNIIGEWNEKNKDMEAILPGWVRGSKSINPCLYGDAHATWKGLGCFGPTVSYLNGSYIDYYYIIALQISGTQVQGILPSSIVHLSYLVFLTITDNPKLTGPISLSLTFLTRLKMIDLHANNLTGTIPEWNTSMESLVEIDFHRNRLEGSIPSLHNCHLLGFLDLSENLLSGPIPKVFPPQLKTLQLAHNRFSWNYACLEGHSILRFWLHELAYLTTLNLSYNQLSGQLPHCWGNLTSLVTLDVSNNTFSGSIGRSLFRNWTKLQYLYGDNNNFSGVLDLSEVNYTSMRQISLVNNSISRVILPDLLYQNTFSLLLGGNPVCNNNNQIPVEYCRSDGNTIIVVKKANKIVIIVAVTVSSFILLVASIVSFVIIRRLWKKVVLLREIQEEFAKNEVQPLLYSYNDLRVATRDFHHDNKLGHGGFGVVYKGVLPDGIELAVKQLNKSQQSLTEFLNEIVAITGVRHRNLVKLKGCCVRSNQRILVYEYVENKNLAEALWESAIILDWSTRFNILLGVAQGLAYLHKDVQPPIIHRDIKPPNILLDKDMEAKIGDFGLALLYPTLEDDHTHLSINNLAGTRGYLAPEYAGYGQVSDKIDVYSFGIVVLEVVSGRKVIDLELNQEQRYLLEWAWELNDKGKLSELIDPKLEGEFTEDDVKQVIKVGLLCTQFATSKRPTMPNVVLMLLGHRELGDVHRDVSHRQVSTELAVIGSTSSLTFNTCQAQLSNGFFSSDVEDGITMASPILQSAIQY